MKTYRCPYCGAQEFEVQDLGAPERDMERVSTAVLVECTACHWVGPVSALGGKH